MGGSGLGDQYGLCQNRDKRSQNWHKRPEKGAAPQGRLTLQAVENAAPFPFPLFATNPTHNPLVPSSTLGGPTNPLKDLQRRSL